jgi:hypothetical protein
MNSNRDLEQDQPLRQALREWEVGTALPQRFHEQVWQRIARQQAQPEPTIRHILAEFIQALVPRPRFAWTYVALLLVLGAAGGSVVAQKQNTRSETDLGSRYIRSLDPYQTAALNR